MIKSMQCGDKTLQFDRTLIMGVLNITPDSFHEPSRYNTIDKALYAAEHMSKNQVDILDIGAESTRPNANGNLVTPPMELERILPIIEAIKKRFNHIISVDTSSADVITESAKLGVNIINDVRSLKRKDALNAAVETGLPVILMHSLIEQPEPSFTPKYDNITQTVTNYLLNRIEECVSAGINRNHIILDPGFGGGMFGKTSDHDLSLLKHLNQLVELDYPVLAGMSRKSFLKTQVNKTAEHLLPASLAVALLAVQSGAHIVRVHDVEETRDVLTILEAVQQAK